MLEVFELVADVLDVLLVALNHQDFLIAAAPMVLETDMSPAELAIHVVRGVDALNLGVRSWRQLELVLGLLASDWVRVLLMDNVLRLQI